MCVCSPRISFESRSKTEIDRHFHFVAQKIEQLKASTFGHVYMSIGNTAREENKNEVASTLNYPSCPIRYSGPCHGRCDDEGVIERAR